MRAAVPGPRGLPVLGSALDFERDALGFLDRAAREHGDLFGFRLLGRTLYIVVHPDDIERVLVSAHAQMHKDRFTKDLSRVLGDGLVTSDGEHWKKQRKLVSHAFTPTKIQSYADTMVAVAAKASSGWRANDVIDVPAEMSRITLEVVGRTLFDADVSADVRIVDDAMRELSDYAVSLEAGLLLPSWVRTPRTLRVRRAVLRIDEVLFRIIAERRPHARESAGLLAALLLAQDEGGGGMSDRELRDECVTLFLAGHETTAIALSYAIYLLARHPEVERRWRIELGNVLGPRPPRSSDYGALELTHRIVKEAMRLYPPVWAIGRELLSPLELRGHRLPAGAQVSTSQWIVHRDPRWFSDPHAFDPERWTEARAKGLPRFAYFPFGGGPRVCIGNHFAMMEAVLLLASFGQRFHFELVSGERLELQPSVTLRPRGAGIHVRLRNAAAIRSDQTLSAPETSVSR